MRVQGWRNQQKLEMGLLLLFYVFLTFLVSRRADAWGKEGHYMVCKIAEKYLTETTSSAVLELLPEVAGGELAAVCSWADEMRWRYRWASPLHYINTPGVCNYRYSNNLTESIMFLAHFVGDVHQPLHVGFEADEGGNTIIIHWYRRKSNLHHVWDVSIIETAMKDYYNNDMNTMLKAIQMNITDTWSDEVGGWEKCRNKRVTCANMYASESIHLACNYAYKDVEQNSTLGDEYFFSRLPIVEKRLAQAGLRLALILNRIFDKGSGKKSGEEILSFQKQTRFLDPM